MQGVKESRLGKALIVLGLEDQFLLNGELQRFPLVQRGALANEIIDEKLKLGKWRGVVNMIFGGFGKADALYEGNIEQLRERIASTAAISGKEEISAETITTLAKKGEYELILRIIESHPKVSLKDLESLRSKIPTAFFEEENKWQQRTRRLDELAAAKAMSEGNYYSALHYFQELKDTQRIQQASDFVLKKGDINYHVAEQIALSDPRQKDSSTNFYYYGQKNMRQKNQELLSIYLI
ncbi:MAG: hypothetical protein NT076_05810 [Candidatus Pacearchaeota archaeon]|nr:hypothetical protein [Candidatus Pacearchaeota archaeon]